MGCTPSTDEQVDPAQSRRDATVVLRDSSNVFQTGQHDSHHHEHRHHVQYTDHHRATSTRTPATTPNPLTATAHPHSIALEPSPVRRHSDSSSGDHARAPALKGATAKNAHATALGRRDSRQLGETVHEDNIVLIGDPSMLPRRPSYIFGSGDDTSPRGGVCEIDLKHLQRLLSPPTRRDSVLSWLATLESSTAHLTASALHSHDLLEHDTEASDEGGTHSDHADAESLCHLQPPERSTKLVMVS